MRRNLAALAWYPDGYWFLNELDEGVQQFVQLLTPPDQIAVQHDDGTWSRRVRIVDQDGPAPYDEGITAYMIQLQNKPD